VLDISSCTQLTDVDSLITSSSIEPNDSTSHNFEVGNGDYELLQSTSNHDLNVSYCEDISSLETKST